MRSIPNKDKGKKKEKVEKQKKKKREEKKLFPFFFNPKYNLIGRGLKSFRLPEWFNSLYHAKGGIESLNPRGTFIRNLISYSNLRKKYLFLVGLNNIIDCKTDN
jgi:hypothetical protein